MIIGIVCWWFNRGQATAGRYLRSVLETLGHRTFVLARPAQDRFDRPGFIDNQGVWDQSGVTAASAFKIPLEEYISWAGNNGIEVVFFDQNYQFDEIAALRAMGVRTIGRFVWEFFGEKHRKRALRAFDTIYSLTECERNRYSRMGIESPRVFWGCHSELTTVEPKKATDAIYFFYPGGYLSKRKPTRAVVEAFSRTPQPDIRLIIKTQARRSGKYREHLGDMEKLDPRIKMVTEDLPTSEYYRLFSSCHVCLAPSRWEGLGLHLYEAAAFSMPVITNDIPPMNEMVRHGYNGLLVGSHRVGATPSGIPAFEPDIDELSRAVRKLSDEGLVRELSINMAATRSSLDWEKTVKGFQRLLEAR